MADPPAARGPSPLILKGELVVNSEGLKGSEERKGEVEKREEGEGSIVLPWVLFGAVCDRVVTPLLGRRAARRQEDGHAEQWCPKPRGSAGRWLSWDLHPRMSGSRVPLHCPLSWQTEPLVTSSFGKYLEMLKEKWAQNQEREF